MAEAGWYYVEGDPPGTVRRWNGVEWIGFPIPDPAGNSGITATHGARPAQRKRFTSGGQALSIITVVMLTVLTGLFVLATIRVWNGAALMPSTGRPDSADVGELGTYIEDLGLTFAALVFGVLLTAFAFVPWIRNAAATAQIHLMRSGIRGQKRKPPSIVVLVILFVVFPGPFIAYWILRAAVSGVAQASNERSGMLGVVSDTATAASTDPRTGMAAISPIKIMIWWAFWWLPAVVGLLAWTGVWILSPLSDAALQTAVQLTAVLLGLEVVSLLCIIATVVQISGRLWR